MKTVWRFGSVAISVTVLLLGLTAQSKQRAEVSLLGIRLFSPASRVLEKFGNPREINYVQVAVQRFDQQGAGQGQAGSGEGGLPGPGGPPGFGGPPGGQPPGTTGAPGEQRIEMETVYIYRGKGGSTYAFVLNKDGRVVQISAYGYKPDPNVRTARGITLGDPYSKVVKAYGYPQEHQYYGDVILMRYNKLGIAFQLDARTNKVMAIVVAAGLPSLTGPGFAGLGGGQQPGGMPGGPTAGMGSGPAGGPPPASGGVGGKGGMSGAPAI
ncbi:MAG: hypothetical protein NZL85_09085 [Fimbriimonadales bacterium]|nr:hypothetical protein [Fimbriimonadales bacterium]